MKNCILTRHRKRHCPYPNISRCRNNMQRYTNFKLTDIPLHESMDCLMAIHVKLNNCIENGCHRESIRDKVGLVLCILFVPRVPYNLWEYECLSSTKHSSVVNSIVLSFDVLLNYLFFNIRAIFAPFLFKFQIWNFLGKCHLFLG